MLMVLLLGAALGAAAQPRPPAVAGRFYPASPKALAALVSRHLKDAPVAKLSGEITALLVPHAGLEFSGFTAARAYKLLQPGQFDTVVVFGTCHTKQMDGAAIFPGDYATPDGVMPTDQAFARELIKAEPRFQFDAAAHKKEHSIEVQLPYLRRRLGPKAKLVAIVTNTQDLETSRALGRALAEVSRGKRALLIASSDLSHYPQGGLADAADKSTLEALATLDAAYFWLTNRFLLNREIPHLAVTYCGEAAVTAVLVAARALGADRFELLGRINSGDVVSERDYNHVVGYAAAAFTRGDGGPPAMPGMLDAEERKALLALARKSFDQPGAPRGPAAPSLSAMPRLNLPGGLFVSVYDKKGELRGCMGFASPQESVAESATRFGAAVRGDPRFGTLAAGDAKLELSLLSVPRPGTLDQVAPGLGVILELEGREGVFLPSVWESIKERESFLGELCLQKLQAQSDCWKRPEAKLKLFSAETVSE